MGNQVHVISELHYPEQTSTGYFLTRIAEGLSSNQSVRVLCWQRTYSRCGKKASSNEFHNGVNIGPCWSATFDKDNFLFRVINVATISLSIFIRSLSRFRSCDLVFVVTNPPLLPFSVMIS